MKKISALILITFVFAFTGCTGSNNNIVPTTVTTTVTATQTIIQTVPVTITQTVTTTPTTPTTVPTTPTTPPPPLYPPGVIPSFSPTAFQTVDQQALGTPGSVTGTIDRLAAYLVEPAKTDFEKARVIYRWVIQNVTFNYSAYMSNTFVSSIATDVLSNRTATAEGFANLFQALANAAKLEVVTIKGWTKGIKYTPGDPLTTTPNHAWNSIKIEGAWYLVDCTWGSGYVSQQQFVQEVNDYYFLTTPEKFIHNHLPEDVNRQMITTTISQAAFAALPNIYPSFLKFDMGLGTNSQAVITTSSRTINMLFTVPFGMYLKARVIQGSNELSIEAQKAGNDYNVHGTLSGPGTYILQITAAAGSEVATYQPILEYKIIITN